MIFINIHLGVNDGNRHLVIQSDNYLALVLFTKHYR